MNISFKKASLFALSLTLVLGLLFFAFSFKLPMSTPGMVVGPGYYPRVLSSFLTIASAIGLFVQARKPDDGKKMEIKKPMYFMLVLGLSVLIAGVWHATHSFYLVAVPVTLVLLWILNPEPASRKKAVKTAGIAAVLLGVVYVLFTVILQLNL